MFYIIFPHLSCYLFAFVCLRHVIFSRLEEKKKNKNENVLMILSIVIVERKLHGEREKTVSKE